MFWKQVSLIRQAKKSGLLDAVTAINFLEDAAPLHCTAPFSKSKIGQIENVQSARILCTQHVSKVKINIWSCPPPKKENEADLNLDSNHSEILKIQTYGKTIGDTQIFHFHPSTGWIGILKTWWNVQRSVQRLLADILQDKPKKQQEQNLKMQQKSDLKPTQLGTHARLYRYI